MRKYIGQIRQLQERGYEMYDSYVGQYYRKEIVDRKSDKRLACYIRIDNREVDFIGERNMIVYFEKDLEGLLE